MSLVRKLSREPVQSGGGERREDDRFSLLLNTRCIVPDREHLQVWLTDISSSGCQLFTGAELLEVGKTVTLLGSGDVSHSGEVAWTSGTKAGVRFDVKLPEDVLERMLRDKEKSANSSESTFSRPVDQFGRALAPLPLLIRRTRVDLL